MAIGSTALANLVIILIIGIVVGLAFNRYARGWLARLGATRSSDITSALVGIAGAFIGFHLGVILGLLPSPADALPRGDCGGDPRAVAVARAVTARRIAPPSPLQFAPNPCVDV